ALTGLMFVVLTLIAGTEPVRRTPEGISTFTTPTVLHFATALLISVNFVAPWRSLVHATIVPGLIGLYGVVHIVRVIFVARRFRRYTPDLEDWIWYFILPLISHGAILAGAIMLAYNTVNALFIIAGGAVLLIFIGIRNALDVVTFIIIDGAQVPPPAD
ncbi:MAG: hypothetical protein ACREJX_13680, partial [Polyangiaceae bacterium]